MTRAAALLVLAAILGMIGAPAAATQPSLVVVPGGIVDGRVRLVVEVPEGRGPVRPETVAVSVDGAPAPGATVARVLGDRLALGLVVDASADGAAMLPVGLGGAANLVLTAPSTVRGAVVTDTSPPAVAVPWPSGQATVLRGLSVVAPGGDRSTATALDLAVAQIRPARDDPRLVVLYTGGHDAGGEPAAAVAERLRAAGVLLAVVCPSAGAPADGRADHGVDFWAEVAAGTGGPAVEAGPSEVIAAFDRAAAELGRRYVVTAPAPARLPATVAVRTADGLAGEATVAAVAGPAAGAPGIGPLGIGLVVGAVLLLVLAGWLVVRRHPSADAVDPPPAADDPPPAPREVWDVPPRLDGAVSRTELLGELEAALRAGRRVWVRPERAGLGTTTLLTEFAHRHHDRYDVAWWVPAMDPDLVADRMAELAEVLGVAGPDDPADRAAAAAVGALRGRDRWLLVFDDAAGPRQLAGYLPDGPGDVVVSSSHAGWRDLTGPVAARGFTRAESVAALRGRRPDLAVGADRIAAALHDLPLAVGPVAAFLADTGLSADTLLALLPDSAGPEQVWSAMLDRSAADDPAALTLLTLVAWLGPAPVPLSLLTGHSEVLPEPLGTVARLPAGLRDRAALLGRRGFAQVAGDALTLHPVAAGLIVARTADYRPDDGGWTAVAVRLLDAAVPAGTDAASWRPLLPHVLAATDPTRRLDPVAAEVGRLLRRAGAYVAARGREHAAQALLDDARGYGGEPTP